MYSLRQGLLIAIEGIDGSGKTTLSRNIYNLLQRDYHTVLTKEPGGTKIGMLLRTLLQDPPKPLAPICEYLLFAADRAQHFHELIIPALEKQQLVISDRMSDSSLVYQAYAKQLDRHMIQTINQWTMHSIIPHLTIYVKISADQAYHRIKKRGQLTHMEEAQLHLMQTFVDGFEDLYSRSDQHIYHINGLLPTEQLAQQTYDYIKQWIINYHH